MDFLTSQVAALLVLLTLFSTQMAHADIVSLLGPTGKVVAVVNTDQVQFAVANENELVIKFAGDDDNTLKLESQGASAVGTLQKWLETLEGSN
ncbi:MAG: hypothetical protein AAF922_03070 [Pseudomonadota bacterium]